MNDQLAHKGSPSAPFAFRAIALLTVGAALFSQGCSSGDAKQQAQAAAPRAVAVAVAQVQKQDVPVYLTGLGAVTAFYTANIKSRVDGQIMRVNFQEGQIVHEGDLLIEIDARPYQVQLEQMQAQLFKDQASLRDAKLNYDRYVALIPSGSIAQQTVDTQKSTVDQLDGQVRTDQAQIDNAKLQIVYCHITAPFTGRVGLRQVDPGNIIHATDTNPMLILTQLQPIAVIFTLPEDQLPIVAKRMKQGTLEVDAFSRDDQTKLGTGKLETIDNQIDPTTGTAKLKAVFDNKDSQLWPNQFVNANLLLETRKNSTVVPTAAILRGPQGTFVYAVSPDKTVQDREVTVALTQGDTTIVSNGLSEGETVVTDGQDKLQRGSHIEFRSGSPAGTAAGVTSSIDRRGAGGRESSAPVSETQKSASRNSARQNSIHSSAHPGS
ncbi:MAG TPA: efflux RND transporter periplasmic adaptor subunit [Terriglobales bacterium]|nr:efflux RND transporter periplasmic adaptor subunit [Terriglobales bacterium]